MEDKKEGIKKELTELRKRLDILVEQLIEVENKLWFS